MQFFVVGISSSIGGSCPTHYVPITNQSTCDEAARILVSTTSQHQDFTTISTRNNTLGTKKTIYDHVNDEAVGCYWRKPKVGVDEIVGDISLVFNEYGVDVPCNDNGKLLCEAICKRFGMKTTLFIKIVFDLTVSNYCNILPE